MEVHSPSSRSPWHPVRSPGALVVPSRNDQLEVIEVQRLHLAANSPPRDLPWTWTPQSQCDRHLGRQLIELVVRDWVGSQVEEIST